jgi:hypothetical protein
MNIFSHSENCRSTTICCTIVLSETHAYYNDITCGLLTFLTNIDLFFSGLAEQSSRIMVVGIPSDSRSVPYISLPQC